jgi:hypothetical protein
MGLVTGCERSAVWTSVALPDPRAGLLDTSPSGLAELKVQSKQKSGALPARSWTRTAPANCKAVLDALREALRHKGWVPMLFDFDQPPSRDLTETVSTLAHLARFVIADLTDPRSIPQELKAIVPNLPSVPVQPLLLAGQDAYAMFADLGGYASVLPPVRYRDLSHLLQILDDKVLRPAEARVAEIAQRRAAFEASWKDQGDGGAAG